MSRRARTCIALALTALAAAAGATSARASGVGSPTPVLAYYYIWYTPSSWKRAKIDYPLLGRYSSDEVTVMRKQIRMAKQAGIDGWIVSWKSTPTLDERLTKLVHVAAQEHFGLSIIYEGLDFERRPLPPDKISSDIDLFVRQFSHSPVFHRMGKPVFVWSGTWKFSRKQIATTLAEHRHDLRFLASERNPRDYAAKASLFDGDAYYWSSINPDTYPAYESKLQKMSAEVHADHGLWWAPAAPGFDARLVGGTSTVPRKGGATLRRELDAAQGSDPDAIGLISWNEFSENSQVEPSKRYGTQSLQVLGDVLGARTNWNGEFDSSASPGSEDGIGSTAEIIAFCVLLLAFVRLRGTRRRREDRRRRRGVRTKQIGRAS